MKSFIHDAEVLYEIDQDMKTVEDVDILNNGYESDELMSGTIDNGLNLIKSMKEKEICPVIVLPAGLVIFEKSSAAFQFIILVCVSTIPLIWVNTFSSQ